MTSDKRDFADFRAFPGSVVENIYTFPTLHHTDSMDRERIWTAYVRIVKDGKRQTAIDWNVLEEHQLPIRDKYFDGDPIPDGSVVQVWNESGIAAGKITRCIPTYITDIAFEGQRNQRNQFQQGLIRARADYLKRQDKGGKPDTSDSKKDATGNKKKTAAMYFPMLAKPWKDGAKHLKYPLYVQPKLDGVRCLTYLKKKDSNFSQVVCYSRARKEFPAMEYIQRILYPYLNELYDGESIYLDGELYKHGESLQDISGRSRNAKRTALNEYHLYDCFYPSELDTTFEDRHEQLEELRRAVERSKTKHTVEDCEVSAGDIIKFTPTHLVKNIAEVNKLFEKYTTAKYEGVILRNADGPYKADATKTGAFLRSNDLVKMKQRFSDEFEVVGYTQGSRGKDVGAIIWICKTPAGEEFNLTPKDSTYEERYETFKIAEAKFEKEFLGRMMTVEYEDLSDSGVPLRAKAVGFRDYE